MSTGKKIAISVLLLAAAVGIVVGIVFGLKYADAKKMAKRLDFQAFQYEAQLDLKQEKLSVGTNLFLGMMAVGAGLEAEQLYHPDVRGRVNGDCLYAEIFPKGDTTPLSELYLGNTQGYLNCEMIYNRMRKYLIGKAPILEGLIGEWKDGTYISMEQFRQLYGIDDTSETQSLGFNEKISRLREKDICKLLLLMKKTQEGKETVYTWEADGILLQCRADLTTDTPAILQIDIDQPSDKRVAINEKLNVFQINLPESILDQTDHVSVKIILRKVDMIEMPTELINHLAIDKWKTISDIIDRLLKE